MAPTKPLVITAGDPAGVGPELCSSLADSSYATDIVVIGDASQLDARLKIIDTPFPATVVPGKPDPANAAVLLDGLRQAVEGCRKGQFSGLVTAPLAKSVVAQSGVEFSGHTEFLAELLQVDLPVMMLVADELRVALATTHLPLREVADAVTAERLRDVLKVLEQDLRDQFGIEHPDILVCGLNPHAGEDGLLGSEFVAVARCGRGALDKEPGGASSGQGGGRVLFA